MLHAQFVFKLCQLSQVASLQKFHRHRSYYPLPPLLICNLSKHILLEKFPKCRLIKIYTSLVEVIQVWLLRSLVFSL